MSVCKVNSLELPKQLQQFMFEHNISMNHIVIGLAFYMLTFYFKEFIQMFVPVVVILYFLHCSILSGEKSNVNHFHFYLPNDHGEFGLIEKIKNVVESGDKKDFNTDTISQLNQIFDQNNYSYKYDFKPYSNSVNNFTKLRENTNISTNKIPSTVTCSNFPKSATTVSVSSTSCKISSTAPTFPCENSIYSTNTSLPVLSMSTNNSSNLLNSNLSGSNSSNSPNLKLDFTKSSDESSLILNHKVLQKENCESTNPLSSFKESEATLKSKPISTVDNFTQCDFPTAKSGLCNVNMPVSSIKESLDLLPQFSGSFEEYRQFKERFKTIVNHLNHTDTSKALLLFMSLSSEVVLSLKSPVVDGTINYQFLWKLLDREYCRPQNGLLYHGAALNSLTEWNVCDSLEKLSKLYKFLLLNHRALERGGELGKGLSVGMIVASKLEGELLSKVCEV